MSRPALDAAWLAAAAVVALRAGSALLPGTWAWSLHLLRFTPPVAGWALWGLAALALVPPVVARMAPALAALGTRFVRSPRASAFVAALAAGALLAALPDRTWFTGDFLLRAGAIDTGRDFARIAPQSLPLDFLLHIDWPRRLAAAGWLAQASDATRVLGALEAAVFAALLVAAGASAAGAGSARVAFVTLALGGAATTLFAGYGKSAGEMVLAATAAALLAPRLAREGRGGVALGLALAAALATHRSALLLVPAWAAAWIAAARAGVAPRGALARAIGIGAPLAVLAAFAPKLLGLLAGFDLEHHLAGRAGGASAFGALAWLDRLNVALAFAPAALAWPLLAARARPADEGGRARAVRWALALPALAAGLLVWPQQGLFRDWDVFAIPGTLLALATAGALAREVERGGVAARRAAPLVAMALAGLGVALLHAHDVDRGLARVRAFAAEAPRRGDAERGRLWEFLGDRAASLGRWDAAAASLEEAVRDQPSPRLLTMLAMAEEANGRPDLAQRAWRRAAERNPADAGAWARLAVASMRLGDIGEARRAALELRRLSPGHPVATRILASDSTVVR